MTEERFGLAGRVALVPGSRGLERESEWIVKQRRGGVASRRTAADMTPYMAAKARAGAMLPADGGST